MKAIYGLYREGTSAQSAVGPAVAPRPADLVRAGAIIDATAIAAREAEDATSAEPEHRRAAPWSEAVSTAMPALVPPRAMEGPPVRLLTTTAAGREELQSKSRRGTTAPEASLATA